MQGRLFIQLIILLNRKLGWRSAYFAVIVFMLFLFSWTFCKLQLYFDLASAIFPWLISLIFACYHLNVNKYGNAMSTSQSDYEISLFRPPCYDKCYINNKTLWNSNTIHRFVNHEISPSCWIFSYYNDGVTVAYLWIQGKLLEDLVEDHFKR